MMPEGRWLPADAPAAETPAKPPADADYRRGLTDGRIDALAEVLALFDTLSDAELHRAVRTMHTSATRRRSTM